ncbi:hypothetical protein [Emticicia sp. SJ17W-69]|uniref:hypothetical protein n=1 Tax=Emticicia sp. SJ17W-69 TaxID=3421657 RepID=UPI003EB7321F
MTAVIDKEMIKKSLKDLVHTEPDFVSELLLEVSADLKIAKKQRLVEIVKEDFKEYDEVFKALA